MGAVEVEAARDRLLRVATELFYERGYHAVGIDLVIERAGVAKATLYRHFPTKDDLIAAALESANRGFWTWLDGATDTGAEPAEALAGMFDAVAALATSPVCLGCAFQATAAEYPDTGHPGHRIALAHKEAVWSRLRDLAVAAHADDPDGLADGLLLLMDGAFASARMYGPDNPARSVGRAARTLIAAQMTDSPSMPKR